jgi:hypothetical protein
MFSPYKLIDESHNSYEIASNLQLSEKLKTFFQTPKTEYMWKMDTSRQRMAPALQHTEMIALRMPIPPNPSELKTTDQWNQVLNIRDAHLFKNIEIFNELRGWLDSSLRSAGASNVEFGRIFFSRHKANTNIGLHTDEGEYFNYFDRFHFVIDQADNENIFFIRNEPLKLLTGTLYWVNNHVPHYLENRSNKDRINLIFDARLF